MLSASELLVVHTPSIDGNPSHITLKYLLDAHTKQSAVRALIKLLRSRCTKKLKPVYINVGDEVVYDYNSTK